MVWIWGKLWVILKTAVGKKQNIVYRDWEICSKTPGKSRRFGRYAVTNYLPSSNKKLLPLHHAGLMGQSL